MIATARDLKVQGHGEHIIESIDDVDKAWPKSVPYRGWNLWMVLVQRGYRDKRQAMPRCSHPANLMTWMANAAKKQRKTSRSQLPSADVFRENAGICHPLYFG